MMNLFEYKLVVGKMKVETDSVAIEDFIALKLYSIKMYSFLIHVHDSSEHKKGKGVNKSIVATIILNEYKGVKNV